MYTIVVTVHIIVCIILVLTVLLQQGKGAEVGAVFGSSEAMFGSSGPASALNKVTTVVAIIFMLTSLALTYLAAHKKGDSIMEEVKVEAPAVPAQSQPAQEQSVDQPAQDTTSASPVQQQAVPVEQPAAVPAGQAGGDAQGEQAPISKSTVDKATDNVVKAASTTAGRVQETARQAEGTAASVAEDAAKAVEKAQSAGSETTK